MKAGDNLYRIGLRFGVSVNQLKSWNNLRGDRVVVGQKLRVSRGAAARSTATAYAPAPAPAVPPIALQMPANGRIVREFGGGCGAGGVYWHGGARLSEFDFNPP